MLGKVFKTQGLIIFGEAQKRIEQSHIDIDVIANGTVISSRCCWAVNNVLNIVVLLHVSKCL